MANPIRFKCDEIFREVFPEPKPAKKFIPDWMKTMMPAHDDNGVNKTIKKCIPFLDAMMLGYIMPLWCDAYFETNETDVTVRTKEGFNFFPNIVSNHSANQIAQTPLGTTQFGANPKKFNSPWFIETEPGWSCLITSPFNHFEDRFMVLTGIVDTDSYQNYVNFPFIWAKPGFKGIIKAGTPIAQIIPFKREDLEAESIIGTINCDDRLIMNRTHNKIGMTMEDGYRDNYWHKKKFT